MADIDLKTETPDTTLPSTGFLFGADSQSAASPSVYSTQAVATALLGSTSLTGATVTADSPVLNLAQTWNNAAVAFTGLKFNVPTDSSASGSLLMDLQVGGSSRFNVRKDGLVTFGASGNLETSGGTLAFGSPGNGFNFRTFSAAVGSSYASISTVRFGVTSSSAIGWSSSADASASVAVDTILTRRAAANLRLGAADAAAPVAQTLSVQSVVAGTTNTAGANLTITGSQGTGTGAGGSIVFQVAPAGSTGTAQNALATALTINSNKSATFEGSVFLPNNGTINSTSGDVRVLSSNGNVAFGATEGRNGVLGTAIVSGSIQITNGAWYNGGDVRLERDAANTLALRNGANAQEMRVYASYTDGANNALLSLSASIGSGYGIISTQNNGTGGLTNGLALNAAGSAIILFQTGGNNRWRISSAGHFEAMADNTYDIGASGANRPRHGYFGGNLVAGGSLGLQIGTGSAPIYWAGRSQVYSPANGNILLQNAAQSDFDRLQFGGTTSSFPALKRSSTTLQARLADDSAFASVQGKLTTETAYTAGAPTATGYLILYDSTGTAYRVPAVLN